MIKFRGASGRIWPSKQSWAARSLLLAAAAAFLVALFLIAVPSKEQSSSRAADLAWTTLTSSGPPIEREQGESSLAHFMRQVEVSDNRLRDLGLKFWKEHPGDPRRYEWLMLTVFMPPHYAANLNDWAGNETRLGPNKAAVNSRALKAWEAEYRAMRAEFWQSSKVTDEERRALWFGELEHKLRLLAEARARGEDTDIRPVLDDVLAFLSRFSSPLEAKAEVDAPIHGSLAISIITEVLRRSEDDAPIDAELWKHFAKGLQNTGNSFARGIGKQFEEEIASNGKPRPLLGPAESQTSAAWARINRSIEFPLAMMLPAVDAHRSAMADRKRKDLGVQLIGDSPNENLPHQVEWFRLVNVTRLPAGSYSRQFTNAIFERPADPDVAAIEEWSRTYSTVRAAFWANPQVSDRMRGSVGSYEIERAFHDAQTRWSVSRDAEPGRALLADIWLNFERYRFLDQEQVYNIVKSYPTIGISDAQILSFLQRVRSLDNEELRRIADGAMNRIALRAKPFEFKAPTLEGEPYDIALLRGKVVLVDLWATSCASCIDAMPRIHDVYRKYKSKGFEVVSVSFDGIQNRNRVKRIERELGLTWTTLAADDQWDSVKERFGYVGFPQYLLLNRDGTLHAGTSEVDMGRNLEALLMEMFAKELAGETRSASLRRQVVADEQG